MVLKRKRGDEWVEVTKPSTTAKASSTTAASSAYSTKSSNSTSYQSTSSMGLSSAPQMPRPVKQAPIEVPATPPTKKSRIMATASQHPMLASLKSHSGSPAYPVMNAHASSSTALSTGPAASQSSAPAKKPTRGRKKANAADEDGENDWTSGEEAGKIQTIMPQTTLRRDWRGFYLLDRTGRPDNTSPTSPSLKEDFKVSGSTGNVYTVTIDKLPRCSCPDSQKGNHCKHILFVFTKVLQVSRDSGLWYQKALLSNELSSIFTNAPLAPNAPTNPRMQAEYNKAVGKTAGPSTSSQPKRMPDQGDDCPICYDSMHGAGEASLVWCEGCGNAVHRGCFTQWSNTARSNGNAVTCVWCRSKWISPEVAGTGAGGVGVRRTASGYLNLAGVGGVSPVRDTSSWLWTLSWYIQGSALIHIPEDLLPYCSLLHSFCE
ncbi:hypothetical protein BKA70DRAFT_1409685 [Coprinopsis sp. MPI-PUGE-AT-0042]|nr:hypothetical protein BKA70DRAFT_1409685 [Coprinopsis sp. MPI-PUGE-AT-0042]